MIPESLKRKGKSSLNCAQTTCCFFEEVMFSQLRNKNFKCTAALRCLFCLIDRLFYNKLDIFKHTQLLDHSHSPQSTRKPLEQPPWPHVELPPSSKGLKTLTEKINVSIVWFSGRDIWKRSTSSYTKKGKQKLASYSITTSRWLRLF